MTDDEDVFVARFDLGEFRHAAARFCKHIILARWRAEPGFLDRSGLSRWGLGEIDREIRPADQLLLLAERDLAFLNREFLPRCGSGGLELTDERTPEGRLIAELAFIDQCTGGGPERHGPLLEAAERIRHGEAARWEEVFDWGRLAAIRDELDRLPHPARDWSSVGNLIDRHRLCVIDGGGRREAFYDGAEIGGDDEEDEGRPGNVWHRVQRAWRLLFALAVRARQGRGVSADDRLGIDLRSATADLRKIVPPSLAGMIRRKGGVYRLVIAPDKVIAVRLEAREYLYETAEVRPESPA